MNKKFVIVRNITLLLMFIIITSGCVNVKFKDKEDNSEEEKGLGEVISDFTNEVKSDIEESQRENGSIVNGYKTQEKFKFEKTEYKLGEEIIAKNKIIKIKSTEDYNGDNSDQNYVPKDGNKYLAINLSIKNTSDALVTYSYNNFSLQDGEGYQYEALTTTNKKLKLKNGDLLPGKEIDAYLVFEVSNNSSGYVLLYESSDGSIKINL